MWNFAFSHLLIISSSVIISVCAHVFGQLSDYYSPTLVLFVLLFCFFFPFAGLSERQEPKQGERSQGDQKQRKGTKQRRGASFNCEPDGDTRESHPTEEERDRRGRGVSVHKHAMGEGIVVKKDRGRGKIREAGIRE